MCLICVKQRKSIQNKQHNYWILINVVTITIKKQFNWLFHLLPIELF